MEKPKTSIPRQAILLPADEVRERPAGAGRDEPNQDPCLGGTMGSMGSMGMGKIQGQWRFFVSLMSMDWFCWENLNRTPWFFPSNMTGFPVNFPIIQFYDNGMKFRKKKCKGQFKPNQNDELWRLRTGEIGRENSYQFHHIQPTDAISLMKNNDLIQKWVCFFLKT